MALVKLTSTQSPAFALRISGSIGTPDLSKPLLSRSSERTYIIPVVSTVPSPDGLGDITANWSFGLPRSLSTICPFVVPEIGLRADKAFCAVTAVMLKTRLTAGGAKVAGQVA